jgi:peroxiredoxin Q/BCP
MKTLKRMTAAALFLGAATVFAQNPAPAAAPVGPQVGDVAPDFTLPASTKAGVIKPVRLSDLKGQVVVLAFFPKARTSG